MKMNQIEAMHRELKEAVKTVLEKYEMDILPTRLSYRRSVDGTGVSEFHVQIKGITQVNAETAVTANDTILRSGFARPNTKAWVTDRSGKRREVIITEAKRSKYAFYFLDDPTRRPMIGHFALFASSR